MVGKRPVWWDSERCLLTYFTQYPTIIPRLMYEINTPKGFSKQIFRRRTALMQASAQHDFACCVASFFFFFGVATGSYSFLQQARERANPEDSGLID